MLLPDAVIDGRRGSQQRVVAAGTEVLAEQAVPPLRGEVGLATGWAIGSALVLLAQGPVVLHGLGVLVERPEGAPLHGDGGAIPGVDQAGGETVADLIAVGVLDRPIVDDEVARPTRNVAHLLGAVVVVDVLVGVHHLVHLAVVPVGTVADDEGTERRRVVTGGRVEATGTRRQCDYGQDGRGGKKPDATTLGLLGFAGVHMHLLVLVISWMGTAWTYNLRWNLLTS